MKKVLSFIVFLLSLSFTYGQGSTHYKKTSGTVNISNGYYTYSTEIKYRIYSAKYGNKPTMLQVGFRNSKITSITYKGKNGADVLTGVSFPVDTRFQANIKGVLILKNNSGPNQVDINISEPASDGALDDFYFSTSVINNIKQTFGEGVTYNDLTPILSNVNLDNFSAVDYHSLTNKMDAVIRQINKDKLLAERAEKERQKAEEKEAEEKENTSESYDYSENSSYSNSSSQYNTNSSNIPSESIYQKRQREANEIKAAQQRSREKAQRRADAQYAENERKINNMNRAADNFKSSINQIADQYNARIKAEAAEREARAAAYQRRKAEEEEARLKERRRQSRERAERVRISEAQNSFYSTINDKQIPVVVNKNKLYFIIITKLNNEKKIEIAPFSLVANNEKELPYKIDVINDYKNKTGRNNAFIQGPYNTFDEQKRTVSSLQIKAQNNYLSSRLIKYSYASKFNATASENKDFWGDSSKKNNSTKSNSTDTDFWGEKKTNTKVKTKTKSSTIWD